MLSIAIKRSEHACAIVIVNHKLLRMSIIVRAKIYQMQSTLYPRLLLSVVLT